MTNVELTVEVWSRSCPAVPERIRQVVEWLDRIEETGRIQAHTVAHWAPKVERTGNDPALEKFEEFRAWGERTGATVVPPFELRTEHSQLTDTTREVLITPELCIAVYDEDDELVVVLPSHRNGMARSIDEFLTSLERHEPVPLTESNEVAAR